MRACVRLVVYVYLLKIVYACVIEKARASLWLESKHSLQKEGVSISEIGSAWVNGLVNTDPKLRFPCTWIICPEFKTAHGLFGGFRRPANLDCGYIHIGILCSALIRFLPSSRVFILGEKKEVPPLGQNLTDSMNSKALQRVN